ncbi:MAG: hypothetical protein ABI380_08240, partial [Edaphobacter sp.]
MGLSAYPHSGSRSSISSGCPAQLLFLWITLFLAQPLLAQFGPSTQLQYQVTARALRARNFLAGHTLPHDAAAAGAMDGARKQQAVMLAQQATAFDLNPLNAAWQSIGPAQVSSIAYGNVTGRVTSIAIDPADTSGNTVYLGTTGGGVWKSTNAAGPSASVTFAPLTDTLPVFNASAGTSVIPSLSIGAVSVQSGIVLAGTGD